MRVGSVLRSALIEKEVQPGVPVAPANLTLFGDLAGGQPDHRRSERRRREPATSATASSKLTVPLRNILMQS